MRPYHPKPEAISQEQKQHEKELPRLAKNRTGGIIQRQDEPSYHHLGGLPKISGFIEELPPTEKPIAEQTMAEEGAMEAVESGNVGSLKAQSADEEALSPPTDVPWGRESPAEIRQQGEDFSEE